MKMILKVLGYLSYTMLLLTISCKGESKTVAVEIDRTPKVVVSTIKATSFWPATILPAKIEASVDVNVAAEAQGVVTKKLIEKGDRVIAGQAIVVLDDEILSTSVASSKEQVTYLQGLLKRQEGLLAKKLVSADVYEQTKSQFVAAKEVLKAGETRLRKATVVSPVNGVVTSISNDVGEFVQLGATIANIVNIDEVRAIVHVPESEVRDISVDDMATIITENFAGEKSEMDGAVRFVNIKGDPATKTYLTEVLVSNMNKNILPEMVVEVRFTKRQVKDVILVPSSSILGEGAETFIYKVDNNIARKTLVKKIGLMGDMAQITGINSGDTIIVKGQHLVADNSKVSVSEEN